jgi:hypothetical protein
MPNAITVTKGDTLLPINSVITIDGNPVDLSAYTCKVFFVNKSSSAVEVNNATTGVTAHPTQVFTASASTDRLTCNGHGVKTTDQIVVATSGTLPTGLAVATRYFPVDISPNAFKLTDVPGGAPIDIAGAGTGTHTFYVVGSIQYDLQTADVDTVGDYYLHFTLWSGSEKTTVPYDGDTFTVHVVAPAGA